MGWPHIWLALIPWKDSSLRVGRSMLWQIVSVRWTWGCLVMCTSTSSLCCCCMTLLITPSTWLGWVAWWPIPLGFVILLVQISEIAGYDEDVVFLVVPDKSEFSRHLVTGSCTLGQIINMIKESELDRLSTPWAVVRVSCLLSRWGTVEKDQGMAEGSPMGEGASESSLALDADEPIFMKENVRLGPFQTQILECRVKQPIGESAQVMVMPLRGRESQPGGVHPWPLDCMPCTCTPGSKWVAARCLWW